MLYCVPMFSVNKLKHRNLSEQCIAETSIYTCCVCRNTRSLISWTHNQNYLSRDFYNKVELVDNILLSFASMQRHAEYYESKLDVARIRDPSYCSVQILMLQGRHFSLQRFGVKTLDVFFPHASPTVLSLIFKNMHSVHVAHNYTNNQNIVF